MDPENAISLGQVCVCVCVCMCVCIHVFEIRWQNLSGK